MLQRVLVTRPPKLPSLIGCMLIASYACRCIDRVDAALAAPRALAAVRNATSIDELYLGLGVLATLHEANRLPKSVSLSEVGWKRPWPDILCIIALLADPMMSLCGLAVSSQKFHIWLSAPYQHAADWSDALSALLC